MQNILESLTLAQENYAGSYVGILRYAVPILSAILLLRCVLPLLTFRREPEIWAWLNMTDGSQIPITHWENVIGRSKSSDVTIDFPTVSRNHAVLTRYDDGSWTITDAGSKDGTLVNGRKVQICALKPKDRISIGRRGNAAPAHYGASGGASGGASHQGGPAAGTAWRT